ncbi:DMT family transporter [Thalassococcus profundi]|uniref:DMT family transporter n=1 Tax=Thalassococcus profundi TaxID=2282382 RepID=A0A369TFT3_9RHOB|nr:DMT family transporter [Thalassococcus profundi]RDD64110.1 DMT family transporter [Thalassococcus profundi]
MPQLSDNTRGALLMMASMACFTFGDACMKLASADLPLSQLLVLRGLFASLIIYLVARRMNALTLDLAARDWNLIALRAVAEVAAAWFFLTALFNMPIANVTALLQMLPLTVTLASAVFFGEPVGWRRWTAILIGFGGMLLIVRPGTEGFNAYSIYALIAVVCVTVRDLATRRMSASVPSLTVTLSASLAVLAFAAVLSLGEDWQPLDASLWGLVAAMSVFIIGGYLFSVMTMRTGEVSVVTPFRYTGLVWALVLGWAIFGEWPVPLTFLGAGIIIATGVFTLLREARARRLQAKTVRI